MTSVTNFGHRMFVMADRSQGGIGLQPERKQKMHTETNTPTPTEPRRLRRVVFGLVTVAVATLASLLAPTSPAEAGPGYFATLSAGIHCSSYEWSQDLTVGPARATIRNPNSPTTRVDMPVSGTYVFDLKCDGEWRGPYFAAAILDLEIDPSLFAVRKDFPPDPWGPWVLVLDDDQLISPLDHNGDLPTAPDWVRYVEFDELAAVMAEMELEEMNSDMLLELADQQILTAVSIPFDAEGPIGISVSTAGG